MKKVDFGVLTLDELQAIKTGDDDSVFVFGDFVAALLKVHLVVARIYLPFSGLLDPADRTTIHDDPGSVAPVQIERSKARLNRETRFVLL